MNERKVLEIINYKGKEIMYNNYSNLTGEEFLKMIEEAEEIFFKLNKKEILELVDITNSFTDEKILEKLKESAAKVKPFIKKHAVIGVTGIKKLLLKSVNLFSSSSIKPFDTKDEAMDWLVED